MFISDCCTDGLSILTIMQEKKLKKKNGKKRKRKVKYIFFQLKVLPKSPNYCCFLRALSFLYVKSSLKQTEA